MVCIRYADGKKRPLMMTELDDVSLCFPSFCFDTLGLILIRCDGLDKYDIILVYDHEVDGLV